MKSKTKRIWRCVFFIALLLWVVQIFSQSLQNGDSSGSRSAWVVNIVQSFFDMFGLQIPVSEFFIRKLGHFGEFFLLGFLLSIYVRLYTRRWIPCLFLPGLLSCCVSIADEIIQLFVPGRCGAILDVMIDFSGAATAILLTNLVFLLTIDRFGKT